MHIGNWQGAKYQVEYLDTFSKQPLSNGDTIEKMIVSNLSCIEKNGMKNELEGNLEMLDIAQINHKIAPLAVCQPRTGSIQNIRKLFNENPGKFVGLKFHPDGHEIMATDDLFTPYLKFAQQKKLPCLFHCGIPWENGELVEAAKRYSSPYAIYEAAKKIPDTPVILAHLGAGGEKVHPVAIDVLLDSIETGKANLYADISWVDIDNLNKPTIIKLIKKLQYTKKGDMTNKLLFGSDAPIGEFATGKDGLNGRQFYEKVVLDIKSAIKNNFGDKAYEITDKIFYKNAKELFFERNWAKNTSVRSVIKKISKTKFGLAIGTGLLAFSGIAFRVFNRKKNANAAVDNNAPSTQNSVTLLQNSRLPSVFTNLVNN